MGTGKPGWLIPTALAAVLLLMMTAPALAADPVTAVHATLSASQTGVPRNAYTQIRFDQEVTDALGEFDPATYRFTAKNAGVYLIELGAEIDDLDTNERLLPVLYRNGAVATNSLWHADRSDTVVIGGLVTALTLDAGDTLEGFVYHNARDGSQTIRAQPWVFLKINRLETDSYVHAAFAPDGGGLAAPPKAWNKLPFDSEVSDLLGEFDPAKGAFTAKNTGVYLVELAAEMDDLDTNERLVPAIYLNGQSKANAIWHSDRSDTVITGSVSTILSLSAGDQVEGYAFHNAGDGVQTMRPKPWVYLKVVRLPSDSITHADLSVKQNVPPNAFTQIAFDREQNDPQAEFDPATGAYTAKAAGLCLVGLGAEVDDIDRNERFVPALYVNGEVAASTLWHADLNDTVTSGGVLTTLMLEAGDVVTGSIFHNAGDGTQAIRPLSWVHLKVVPLGEAAPPPPPPEGIIVVNPNGGETWTQGANQQVTWTSSGYGALDVLISRDNGGSWNYLAQGTTDDGLLELSAGGAATNEGLVRVQEPGLIGAGAGDSSDAPYAIVAPPGAGGYEGVWVGFDIYLRWENGSGGAYNQTVPEVYVYVPADLDEEFREGDWVYWSEILDMGNVAFQDHVWDQSEAGAAATFETFASLVEVRHLTRHDDYVDGPADPPWASTIPLAGSAAANLLIAETDQPVQLVGLASGGNGPYTWSWDFGDSTGSSSEQSPQHVYTKAGTYTATLTVTDSDAAQVQDTVPIQVVVPGVGALAASAGADPTSGAADLAVQFTGGVTGGVSPYGWSWDFGDGSAAGTSQNPQHTYTAGGSYTAVLTVTDDTQATAQAVVQISVSAPGTGITVTAPDGGESWTQGDAQSVTWSSSGYSEVDVLISRDSGATWNYLAQDTTDDGEFGWTVSGAGTAQALVRVADTGGEAGDTSDAVFTVAEAGGGGGGYDGFWAPFNDYFRWENTSGSQYNKTIDPVWFYVPTAMDSEFPVDGQWLDWNNEFLNLNFPDQETKDAFIAHIFAQTDAAAAAAGLDNYDHIVSIGHVNRVEDDGSGPTDPPWAGAPALAASAAAGQLAVQEGQAVQLAGLATGGTEPYSWSWDMGDSSGTSTSQNPQYTFNTAGTYTVTLTVTDDDGTQVTDTVPITVVAAGVDPLAASAGAAPTGGERDLAVQFSGGVTGGTAPYSWSWDFGDGSGTATVQSPQYTYTAAGVYTATLTVTDDNSDQAQDTVQITVTEPGADPLEATAAANPTGGERDLAVDFTGGATGGTDPYSWSWDFGDGSGPSTAQNPSHTYTKAGSFTATLTVTDDDGLEAQDTVQVNVTDPAADPLEATAAADPVSGQVSLTVQFTGGAAGGTPSYSWSWNFGDGTSSSSSQSPAHTYKKAGSFTATLVVTDNAGTQDSDTVLITVTSSDEEPYEGYGVNNGGAGGSVINVANASQLYSALSKSRVMIMANGDIETGGTNIFSGSNLTLDGQGTTTIWGDGGGNDRMLELTGQNLIIRNLRLRNSYDNISFKAPADHVMISHVSSTGSYDDGMSIAYGTQNVTVQYSAIFGCTRSMFIKYNTPQNISLHHNFFRCQHIRGPLVSGALRVDMRNCVQEDWNAWCSRFESDATGNAVNNIFVLDALGADGEREHKVLYPYSGCGPHYFGGNVVRPTNIGLVIDDSQSENSPLSVAPVTTQSVSEMEPVVRARAGCLPRDWIDNAYINATDWDIGISTPFRVVDGP